MDEWLSITEEQLINEELNGTTILDTIGIDMIGESNTLDLHDINLHEINKGVVNRYEHKKLCFLKNKINDINYLYGCHKCFPKGTIKLSSRKYVNKHMSILGLPFIINKSMNRYKRAEKMRSYNLAVHYLNDFNKIKKMYNDKLHKSFIVIE